MIVIAAVLLIVIGIVAGVAFYSIPATVEAWFTGQAGIILAQGRAAAMQTQANGEWWQAVTPLLLGVLFLAMIGAIALLLAYNRKSDNDTRIVLALIRAGYTPYQIASARYKALPKPKHPMIKLSNAEYKQLESKVK